MMGSCEKKNFRTKERFLKVITSDEMVPLSGLARAS